jgi:hypothetical protein
MSLFQKEFLAVLEADENQAATTDTAAAEQAAMQQQLDPTTDPKALDANAPQGVDQARAGHNAAQKKILGTWIKQVADFVEFLNILYKILIILRVLPISDFFRYMILL